MNAKFRYAGRVSPTVRVLYDALISSVSKILWNPNEAKYSLLFAMIQRKKADIFTKGVRFVFIFIYHSAFLLCTYWIQFIAFSR